MVWTFKFQYDNTLSALENASVEVLETFKFQYDNTLRNVCVAGLYQPTTFKFQYDNTLSQRWSLYIFRG